MAEQRIVVIAQIEKPTALSLEELCDACHVTPEYIQRMLEYGAIEAQFFSEDEMRFDMTQLRRIRTALHLQEDLEVNLAGAALVMDLMDQMETLRTRLEMLEKHLDL